MSFTRLSLSPAGTVSVTASGGVGAGLAMAGGVNSGGGNGAIWVGAGGRGEGGGWVGGGGPTGVKVAVGAGPAGVNVAVGAGPAGVNVAVGGAGADVTVGAAGVNVGVGGGEFCMNPLATGAEIPANIAVRITVMIPSQKSRCRSNWWRGPVRRSMAQCLGRKEVRYRATSPSKTRRMGIIR